MCGRRNMTCRRRARLRLSSDAFTSAAALSWYMYFCLAIIIINMGDLRKANGANKVLPLSLALSPSVGAGAGGPYSVHTFPQAMPMPCGVAIFPTVYTYVCTGCNMVADQR